LKRAGHDVSDVRLVVDKSEAEEHVMPRGRTAAPQSESALPPLPPELLLRLRKVDDPNLRAAIAEAARFSLAHKQPAAYSAPQAARANRPSPFKK
jgi:hypothetical protein